MVVPWVDRMEHATDMGSREVVQTTAHENVDFAKFHEMLQLVAVFDEKTN